MTLADLEFLHRDDQGQYGLGRHLFALARRHSERFDMTDHFVAVCRDLGSLPTETLLLSIREGRDVMTIAKRPGSSVIGVDYRLGYRLPAHATSMGKAMLSLLPDDEVRALYGDAPLETVTSKTVATVPELLAELAEVRAIGHAVDDEQSALGTVCLGVPITVTSGDLAPVAVGAVAVSFVRASSGVQFDQEVIEAVTLVAETISERII